MLMPLKSPTIYTKIGGGRSAEEKSAPSYHTSKRTKAIKDIEKGPGYLFLWANKSLKTDGSANIRSLVSTESSASLIFSS